MNDKKDGFCFSYVVKETPDKGLGVFAGEAIKQGSVVWRHVPGQYIVYNEQTFKALIAKMTRTEVVYELTHVFALPDFPNCVVRVFDAGVLFNHSRDDNLITNKKSEITTSLDETSAHYIREVTKALLDDRYAMIATRDIQVGEEFTNDYATEVGDPPFFEKIYKQYEIDDSYMNES